MYRAVQSARWVLVLSVRGARVVPPISHVNRLSWMYRSTMALRSSGCGSVRAGTVKCGHGSALRGLPLGLGFWFLSNLVYGITVLPRRCIFTLLVFIYIGIITQHVEPPSAYSSFSNVSSTDTAGYLGTRKMWHDMNGKTPIGIFLLMSGISHQGTGRNG